MKSCLSLFLMIFLITSSASPQEHVSGLGQEQGQKQLVNMFSRARVHGHIRNYFLNTINSGGNPDFYTNATGAAVGVRSGSFHGFEIGVKGIFTYKTFGGDLRPEEGSRGGAKWEYELYDVMEKGNFDDLDRLEELYVRYTFGKSYLSFGKIRTEYTPLLNESDGRMKPFAFKGTWGNFHLFEGHDVDLGWLTGVSPRSTTEWYDLHEGIGLFAEGLQPNGEQADYHEQYNPAGIGVLGYHFQNRDFRLDFYDWFLDKMMNTTWVQADYTVLNLNLGVQYVYQFPMSYSEELPYINRYIQPDENGQVLSSQLAWKHDTWCIGMAYTHAFDSGRFLFPKELGRDHFYTSISRSRLEGLGGVNVYTFKGEYFVNSDLSLGLEMQQLSGIEMGEEGWNKYNADKSFQVNTRLQYMLHGFLEGLQLDLLWVYKQNDNILDPGRAFNKSNYNQVNFVTNFYF